MTTMTPTIAAAAAALVERRVYVIARRVTSHPDPISPVLSAGDSFSNLFGLDRLQRFDNTYCIFYRGGGGGGGVIISYGPF